MIVANPHGITCQGCGFINTPRATLTTGKPIMDGQRLERFQVEPAPPPSPPPATAT